MTQQLLKTSDYRGISQLLQDVSSVSSEQSSFDNDYQDLDTLDRSSTEDDNNTLKDLPNYINDEVLDLKIGLVFLTLEVSTEYI